MKLPEWWNIDKKPDSEWTPLEQFIYRNEPAGSEAEKEFREYLSSAIDFVVAERTDALINTPHTHDFIEAVRLEMPHQRERWGSSHDAGKTPADWFWLIGHLAGKAVVAAVKGDIEKAKHHVITSAAALGNWFLAITGESTSMRPGIESPEKESL